MSSHTTTSAVLRAAGMPLTTETLTVRAPRGNEVLVRVKAIGVCHSDLHLTAGDWPVDQAVVPGHEASGIVEATGPDTVGVQVGDHVVLSWFPGCSRCIACMTGRGWACGNNQAVDNKLPDGSTAFADADGAEIWPFLGLGAFSELVVVPENAAIVVPTELPFDIGALIGCSVTTGVGAVTNTVQVRPGSSAVVMGCGGIGQSILLGLVLAGADPIVAVDLSPERLTQATRLGATVVLDGAAEDLVEQIKHHTDGGADYAFEAIGRVPTIELGPSLIRAGGTFVIVGMAAMGARGSFDVFDLADQGKTVVGCNYGSSTPAVDFTRLARLYLAGRLPLDKLIGRTLPLAQADEALEDLQAVSGLRTILTPGSPS